MNSTWEVRDLPVLRAVVKLEEELAGAVHADQLESATGLGPDDVQRALGALANEHPPFFTVIDATSMEGRHIVAVHSCTGHARRTVGAWPTPDALTDRLVAALRDAADNAPTEEERSGARKLLDGVAGIGRGVLTGVLVKVFAEGL